MIYNKEQSHKEIRAAIAAWVLDPTLPEPIIQGFNTQVGLVEQGSWCDLKLEIHLVLKILAAKYPNTNYRLKPKPQPMIRVNGIEVPAPEMVSPRLGTIYFIPSIDNKEKFVGDVWENDSRDLRLLAAGLVYLNTENTVARSDAMLKYEVVV